MKIKIEHNIAIPPPKSAVSGRSIPRVLQAMRVKDSFKVLYRHTTTKAYMRFVTPFFTAAKRAGVKITTRLLRKGVRIWRVG